MEIEDKVRSFLPHTPEEFFCSTLCWPSVSGWSDMGWTVDTKQLCHLLAMFVLLSERKDQLARISSTCFPKKHCTVSTSTTNCPSEGRLSCPSPFFAGYLLEPQWVAAQRKGQYRESLPAAQNFCHLVQLRDSA